MSSSLITILPSVWTSDILKFSIPIIGLMWYALSPKSVPPLNKRT